MAYRSAVVGGSGYTGAELLRLVAGHPELEVVHVTAEANAGRRVAALYPALGPAYADLAYEAFDPRALAGLDVVFCGLPHGESQRLVPTFVDAVGHVVDLGADFRLPASTYEQWYGGAHEAPTLLGRFSFGMTELFRPEVRSRSHVANPGCYPTAASLALAPLLADGAVEADVVVNAVSGLSGAGRSPKETSLLAEANENVTAYGLLTHRHTAEIEHALGHVAGAPVTALFQPHLAPMTRGILATCYAHPARAGLTTAGLLDTYRAYYEGEPFVHVVDEPSGTKATYGANSVHVSVRADDRTGTVLAFAAEDNLVKGASGQALQNANVLLGLPETTGLTAVGIQP